MIKEKDLLTKEDILKFDEEIELIPLTFDFVFKGSFVQELPLLKKFLLSTLDTEIDIDKDCSITLLNNELPKENKKEYKKTVDVYIRLNEDFYINLEINREIFKYVEYRNLLYFAKICSMLLEKSDGISTLHDKTLIQININAYETYENIKDEIIDGTERTFFCNEDGRKKFKNLAIVSKYIDYYRNLYYNKGVKLTEGEMWLVVLSSKNFMELYETLGHVVTNKERDKFIRKVKNMCSENFQIHEWEREKCQQLVESEKRRYQQMEKDEMERKRREIEQMVFEYEESKAELEESKAELEESKAELEESKAELEESKAELEESKAELEESKAELEELMLKKEKIIKQGLEQGLEKKEKEIIKNMLENGFDDVTISKISNLSIEKIIKIKESL